MAARFVVYSRHTYYKFRNSMVHMVLYNLTPASSRKRMHKVPYSSKCTVDGMKTTRPTHQSTIIAYSTTLGVDVALYLLRLFFRFIYGAYLVYYFICRAIKRSLRSAFTQRVRREHTRGDPPVVWNEIAGERYGMRQGVLLLKVKEKSRIFARCGVGHPGDESCTPPDINALDTVY